MRNFGPDLFILHRFSQRPPWPWLAMSSSFGTLVKALLIGHIFHATLKWVAKFEDYFQERTALKKHQEVTDVAKSQLITPITASSVTVALRDYILLM